MKIKVRGYLTFKSIRIKGTVVVDKCQPSWQLKPIVRQIRLAKTLKAVGEVLRIRGVKFSLVIII